ncbi:MAG TPA: DUF1819 family protein [Candidatus Avamphibacillus sp.]|nr:DUF1819 family protein [Candidatus Avamphibacillus sp.]
MALEKKYTTSITGSGFMMFEFKQIVGFKIEGLNDKEIKEKVLEENVFQYNKTSSLKRAIGFLLNRVNALDSNLRQMVKDEPIDVGKVINLYSIMKVDQLFYEFMQEVVRDCLENDTGILEVKNVNVFFVSKAEQSDFINNLADSTLMKLKRTYHKVLLETGMLKDLKSRELKPLLVDEWLKHHLVQIGDIEYLKAMGDVEGIV